MMEINFTATKISNSGMPTAMPLSAFPKFSQFPTEIRLMIWREFYLEPRYFEVRWKCGIKSSSIHLRANVLNHSIHHVGSRRHYFTAIDTTINRESYLVATKIRPRFWLPMWCSPTYDSTWSTIPSVETVPDVSINWEVDYLQLNVDIFIIGRLVECSPSRECSPTSWFSDIHKLDLRNLSTPETDRYSMSRLRQRFLNLREVRWGAEEGTTFFKS